MARATVGPVTEAMLTLLRAISLGGAVTMPVGDGADPNHEPPYLILMGGSSGVIEGSMVEGDLDADEELRYQVNGCGKTREQAQWASDKARGVLTKSALTTALSASSRVCQYCFLDFHREPRNDLGVTEPLWESVDQYLVKTTPA